MSIIIDGQYRWRHRMEEGLQCWHVGEDAALDEVISFLRENPSAPFRDLKQKFLGIRGNFAAIIEQGDRLIGLGDRIRSYPVFYSLEDGRVCFSNSARALKKKCGLGELDTLSLLEFAMAGYVTGSETVIRDLHQIQAGEFVLWEKSGRKLLRDRYFLFRPSYMRREREEDLIEELDRITHEIFRDVIEKANGAPIWVPLSGGLDSRLVLCKLKELGYEDLTAFSYGPPGNYEARAAGHVAARLGVPWFFVPSKRGASRRFFRSPLRKGYWDFADGLCSIPFMQDLDVLLHLRESGRLPDNAIMINGQSGDFITGGHIPETLMRDRVPRRDFLEAVTAKHFSLWLPLITGTNRGKVEEKISELANLKRSELSRDEAVSSYEQWEWQERQCKYVVNGQRIYDFMDISWELPLWDAAYLDFWKDIPPRHKFGQDLYIKFLRRYNFKGLFRDFTPTVWRWPGPFIAVLPLAWLAKAIFGNRCRENVYRYARYFGHYSNHYACYGPWYFLRNAGRARGEIAFSVARWFRENGIPFDLGECP